MGKGQNTTTNQTTTTPNSQAMSAYSNVLNQAQGVAATPYQSYGGELVAPFNSEQNMGVAGVNQYANAAQPAIDYATNQAAASSSPLTAAQIQQYESPYTQQVVNATQAQFNNQNAQQQQGVVGNAIAQGALGGNRSAVAQAETANQEQLAQAPVIAGLENQGYTQGVQTAEQQQQTGLQGASTIGNLGVAGQTAGISGAGAQLGAGTAQQTTQQALDTALYGQFQNQQAYPFQEAQWLAGIDTGVGSQMGGTSTGETTAPAPNIFGQIAGGVTSGVGALGATGAYGANGWLMPALAGLARGGIAQVEEVIKRALGGAVNGVAGYADGGTVRGYADGGYTSGVAGVPYSGARGYIPTDSIVHGSGPPPMHAPAAYQVPQNPNLTQQAQSVGALAKTITDANNGVPGVAGQPIAGAQGQTSYGGSSGPTPLYGQPAVSSDFNPNSFARGGVAGFADGGDPTFNDMWADRVSSADLPPMNPSGNFVQPKGVVAPDDSASFKDRYNTDSMPPMRNDSNTFNERYDASSSLPPMQTKPPVDDSLNPGDPIRLPSPAAVQSWRDGVDRPIGKGVVPPKADDDDDEEKPSTEPKVTSIATTSNGVAPPEVRAANEPKGFDWSSNNKLWPSLMSAGFGMMASRSPFALNAIGEGGQAGMNTYTSQAKAEQDAKHQADQLELERQRLLKPYSEMTAAEKAADARAKITQTDTQINQPVIIGPDGKPMVNSNYVAAQEAIKTEKWAPIGTVMDGNSVHPLIMNASTHEVLDAATGKPPTTDAKYELKGQKAEISDDDARAIAKYTVDTGDNSRLSGLGISGNNRMKVQSAINQYLREKAITNDEMARRKQEYAAQGTASNAGARVRANREENLAIILNTTEAAIPAAIEASKEVARTGFVPLNKILQNGRLMTSNPSQVKLGIANLQLAEGWARAMNPTGVMRESDREKALQYLDTALSSGTYEQAVKQIHMQIIRERESVHRGSTTLPRNGEAPPPGQATSVEPTAAPAGAVGTRKDTTGKNWYVDSNGKALGPAQ